MKLIIFGATGSIGRHLVEQALAQGHVVTGFARRPCALPTADDRFTPLAGDALDAGAVAAAVAGHDAVLIALGAGRRGTVRATGTRNIINAMRRHNVRRLVCQTTLGVGDSYGNLNFFWKRIMFGALLREVLRDHTAQEAAVRDSALDWIIVRPAAFTDGAATGAYQHGFAPTRRDIRLKIPRADVAGFMLQQIADNTYLRQAPGLSR